MINFIRRMLARWTYIRNYKFCTRNGLSIEDIMRDRKEGWKYPHKLPNVNPYTGYMGKPVHNWRFKYRKSFMFNHQLGIKWHPEDEEPYREEQRRIQAKHHKWFQEQLRRQRNQGGYGGPESSYHPRRSSGGGSSNRSGGSNSPSVCNHHGSGM